MILLFTDFGHEGPYAGELRAALARTAPEVPIIDLMHDAPAHDPRRAAYLLAHLSRRSQPGEVWLAVVDPGVGGDRPPVICEIDGVWMVGPENGLFEIARRRAASARCWRIGWSPKMLSETFHGRDLFAPIAAHLSRGLSLSAVGPPVTDPVQLEGLTPQRCGERIEGQILHVDRFGNLVTSISAADLAGWEDRLRIHLSPDCRLERLCRTYADVPPGELLALIGSADLLEISVNGGSAARLLDLERRAPIAVEFRNSSDNPA